MLWPLIPSNRIKFRKMNTKSPNQTKEPEEEEEKKNNLNQQITTRKFFKRRSTTFHFKF